MSEPEDTLIAEISELREALARHCACTHDGRGELTNECEEHRSLEDERDRLAVMANALAQQLQIEAEARGKAEAQVRELRAQLELAGYACPYCYQRADKCMCAPDSLSAGDRGV